MFVFFSLASFNSESQTNDSPPQLLTIALLDQQHAQQQALNEFAKTFWQYFASKHNYQINFVYLTPAESYTALAQSRIDIISQSTFTVNDNHFYHSLAYAKLTQYFFQNLKRPTNLNNNNINLAIYTEDTSLLNFLNPKIKRHYFASIDELIKNRKDYDLLYSSEPWLLKKALEKRGLNEIWDISSNTAPEITYHFATRKTDFALISLINDTIRHIPSSLNEIWQNQFLPNSAQAILLFGQYLKELSQDEKRFIIEQPIVYYPMPDKGYPPYLIPQSIHHINKQGLTIDILKHINKLTGIKFLPKYSQLTEQTSLAENNSTIDLQVLAYDQLNKNNHHIASSSYAQSRWTMAYRNTDSIKSNFTKLDQHIIAVLKNTELTTYIENNLPQAQLKYFDDNITALNAVARGAADVYLGLALNTAYLIKNEKLTNLTSSPLIRLNLHANFNFSTDENNLALINLINRALNNLPPKQFDNIYNKWSKTAFHNVNVEQQVATAYRQSAYVLLCFAIITILVTWVYYRQIKIRKNHQAQIEHALKIAEEARINAEKSGQAKIDFLARMSHEIRTPLNGIFGMTEALTFTELNVQQKDLLKTLNASANSLMSLLNNVLDFSKMASDKLLLEPRPVNLTSLLQQIVDAFTPLAKNKHLAIHITIAEEITNDYLIDPFSLTQVFNNLLSNAIKFTEQGSINISISRLKQEQANGVFYDTLLFKITDTGIGIEKKDQAQLFSPFIQADSSITRKYGGTGLGLAICQEIVQAMGGNITLTSTIGIGSTFAFNLALKQSDKNTLSTERRQQNRYETSPDDTKFQHLNVLIAEDNPVNIKVLKAQLARLNIETDVAEDGQQALNLCQEKSYDIIISDCHMPFVDGFELAEQLQSTKQGNAPWLIAITADALTETAKRCEQAGFNDYIAKPCTQAMLTDKIHHALRQLNIGNSVKADNLYHYFQPQLLAAKQQNTLLAKNLAHNFVSYWGDHKKHFLAAIQQNDYLPCMKIIEQLMTNMSDFCDDDLIAEIASIEHQIQTNHHSSLEYSLKLLITIIDVLATEIEQWLSDNAQPDLSNKRS